MSLQRLGGIAVLVIGVLVAGDSAAAARSTPIEGALPVGARPTISVTQARLADGVVRLSTKVGNAGTTDYVGRMTLMLGPGAILDVRPDWHPEVVGARTRYRRALEQYRTHPSDRSRSILVRALTLLRLQRSGTSIEARQREEAGFTRIVGLTDVRFRPGTPSAVWYRLRLSAAVEVVAGVAHPRLGTSFVDEKLALTSD